MVKPTSPEDGLRTNLFSKLTIFAWIRIDFLILISSYPRVLVTLGFLYFFMILFLQYTITDSRYFSNHHSEQLNKPQWPSPKPFGEFVRNTGGIIERNKQGLNSWVGENFICQIKKGIQFSSKTYLESGITISNISKHLYANENYVLTKYEFVFNIKLPKNQFQVNYNLMKTMINEILASKVKIKINEKSEIVTLDLLPKKLVDFHYNNSTFNSSLNTTSGKKHVLACTPQLYFYLENNESTFRLDSNYKKISDIPNFVELYGAWHNHKNNPFRVWIHYRKSKSVRVVQNRETRMTIMRLHSEYECLKNLFMAISNGLVNVESRTPLSDDLQNYFNTTIRFFLLQESNLEYQTWRKDFFDYFSKIFAKASPGEIERIRIKIEEFDFRQNIRNKTNTFIVQKMFMENKFENNNSTIISQGNNNTVQNNKVVQNIGTSENDINFDALLTELEILIEKGQKEATTTEQRRDILALSEAQDAAKKRDGSGVIGALKVGGKFVADIATRFAASFLD